MAEKKFSLADLTDDQIALASREIREAGSALGMVQGMFIDILPALKDGDSIVSHWHDASRRPTEIPASLAC